MPQHVRIALDSTDSIHGGCTTHALLEVWRQLAHLDALGPPRLVRLNPNIPYKTRGNGALCVELGHGRGRRRIVGEARGVPLYAAEAIDEPTPHEQGRTFDAARRVVDEHRAPDANTGLAVLDTPPDESLYRRTVRSHIDPHTLAPPRGIAHIQTWNDGRGLIGAQAAAAWPADQGTYEAIAYRKPEHVGTPRRLSSDLGPRLDQTVPTSFDNWDPRHEHLRIAPRSPCPILAGIRGTDPTQLVDAIDILGPEPHDSWLLFATNQATGDHLTTTQQPAPYESPLLDATVTHDPTTTSGGHVALRVAAGPARLTAWAFEPTKEFRTHVRALHVGDHIRIEGGVHHDPTTVALEAFTHLEAAPRTRLEPPTCRDCGARTKSAGRRAGYRCRACGRRNQPPHTIAEPSPLEPTRRYTVPIMVRRHLSRPNHVRPVPLATLP